MHTRNLVRFWYILQVKSYLQVIPTGKLLITTCDLVWFWDPLQVKLYLQVIPTGKLLIPHVFTVVLGLSTG